MATSPRKSGATGIAPIRVNIGGGRYKDKSGALWQADKAYVAGSWGLLSSAGTDVMSTKDRIAGTDDQPLFQSIRVGERMGYRFDLPNGACRVRILFAEIYWESADAEDEAVIIQDKEVLSHFNIFSEAGHDAAVEKTFDARVANGKLEVLFEGQSLPMHSGARACAIEITPKAAK